MNTSLAEYINGKRLKFVWRYTDHLNNEIGVVGRYQDNGGNKDIIPFFKKNGDSWAAGVVMNPRPLFGLGLLASHPKNKPVYIVEGEKCAAALQSLRVCAVTSLGGAHNADKADWSALRGYTTLLILPDNDLAGEIYAKTVYQAIKELFPDADIQLIRLPDLGVGQDVVNWLQQWEPDWNGFDPIYDPTNSLREEFVEACKTVSVIPEDWNVTSSTDSLVSDIKAWGIPNDIDIRMPDVTAMTEDLLPDDLKSHVIDVSQRMQAPPDFIVMPLLVAISSVIGAGCSIQPKKYDTWSVIPNLWGMSIGKPSRVLKSPTLKEGLKFLDRLQAEYGQQFEQQQAALSFDAMANKAQIDDVKSQLVKVTKGEGTDRVLKADDLLKLKADYLELAGKDDLAMRRIFRTNDATIPSMTQLQAQNPRGVLYFRDELAGLMVKWEREQDERAYFLEAWNGNGSYTDYKITRGLTEAKQICVSILGGIQPDKLLRYLSQTANGNNDGLMQRFQLAVWPDESTKWEFIDRPPNRELEIAIYQIHQGLAEMDFTEYGAFRDNFDGRPYFKFDDEGQVVFNEWMCNLQNVKLVEEEHPLMIEHLSKYRSLMPSLAVIFHCIELALGKAPSSVSEKNARLAAAWCDYLETHARRIYAMVRRPEHDAAIILAKKIKSKVLPDGFTSKMVYDKNWHGLKDRKEVDAACQVLIEENWLKVERQISVGGVGRPPLPRYLINPSLL